MRNVQYPKMTQIHEALRDIQNQISSKQNWPFKTLFVQSLGWLILLFSMQLQKVVWTLDKCANFRRTVNISRFSFKAYFKISELLLNCLSSDKVLVAPLMFWQLWGCSSLKFSILRLRSKHFLKLRWCYGLTTPLIEDSMDVLETPLKI